MCNSHSIAPAVENSLDFVKAKARKTDRNESVNEKIPNAISEIDVAKEKELSGESAMTCSKEEDVKPIKSKLENTADAVNAINKHNTVEFKDAATNNKLDLVNKLLSGWIELFDNHTSVPYCYYAASQATT